MQEHYSTVYGEEQRTSIARVISLFGGERTRSGGEHARPGGEQKKKAG
jgi:hypothetical protein